MHTLTQLNQITGGLSAPSKMPCQSYSIPAQACVTGRKFVEVSGSVCEGCYALRGNYRFPSVKLKQSIRLESLGRPDWVEAMASLISMTESSGFFRWHDSGDIQSVDHLRAIAGVCRLTPHIRHWLPTREYSIVGDYLTAGETIPDNLTVRLSAYMIDGEPPLAIAARYGVQASTVTRGQASCPASQQGNKCLTCRACWDRSVPVVSYRKH